jgi:hypothetical protein
MQEAGDMLNICMTSHTRLPESSETVNFERAPISQPRETVEKGAFHYGRIPPGLAGQFRHAYLRQPRILPHLSAMKLCG